MSSLKVFIPELLKMDIPFSQQQMLDVIHSSDSEMVFFDLNQMDFFKLLQSAHGTLRTFSPAHFTTSCLLFNNDATQTLLVLHKKYKEWVNPGGHADGDWFWLRSALRECYEETGVETVALPLKDVAASEHFHGIFNSQHLIPSFVQKFSVAAFPDMAAHEHFDVVYVLKTETTDVKFDPNESLAIRWFNLEEIKPIARGEKTSLPLSQLTAQVVLRGLQALKN